MTSPVQKTIISLELDALWDDVFTIAPLVIIGSLEPDGTFDLAPKHMATPLSWQNHFGFVCTPRHATYQNIKRERVFTVSYPRPTQTAVTSFTASLREDDGGKSMLSLLSTFPAQQIKGVFVEDAYLFLECKLDRIIDGFAENSLIAGEIVAAYVAEDSLRRPDLDDNDLLARAPLLAYINWGRFARVNEGYAFPFLKGFKR